jgi:hypothetical protein
MRDDRVRENRPEVLVSQILAKKVKLNLRLTAIVFNAHLGLEADG